MTAKHEPTEQTRANVKSMAGFGTPQSDIASNIGVSEPTLRKHYRAELDTGAAEANAMVGQYLFSLASGRALRQQARSDGTVVPAATHADCKTAAMFWAKTRMGWRETDRLEVTGKDGENIKVDAEVNAIDKLIGAISRFAPAADAKDDTEDT